MLAGSIIAGIALLAMGNLGSSRLGHAASGGGRASHWEVTCIEFIPNWWLAVPLATCFVVGLLLALLPQRR
jgi:hypothetical protein